MAKAKKEKKAKASVEAQPSKPKRDLPKGDIKNHSKFDKFKKGTK